ncbi:MAG: recombinase family protein [Candidatus Riflebacteria bacterium]|nr:recombinase family protein [Candidatus Riflebacteria bacterium]
MNRFAIFTRCSTDEQVNSGHGLNAQLDICKNFASRNGGEISGIFSDEGISGAASLDKRLGLLSAISSLEKGDNLLVAKRDRLARDPLILAMIEASVNRKGARIISASGEGTESDEPTSILMRRMVDAFAEYERLVIKSRTKCALQAKIKRNERAGHIPFGFRLASDGCHLEKEPNEQEILKTIQELRSHRVSLRQIAEELNSHNFKNRGNPWNNVSVLRVSRGKVAA